MTGAMLVAMAYSKATELYLVLAQSGDDEVGGGFAVDTLERLLGVSPTLAAVVSAAFFIWRFQAREVRSKEAENLYLRNELVRERTRNEELDHKIDVLSEQIRELRDEVHWLRRFVPNEVLGEEVINATEES